jgi:hypothetical protein
MAPSERGSIVSRRVGIVISLVFMLTVIGLDWSLGSAPDPYRAPDPMAFGSKSGASGAICTFAPGAEQ